MSETTDPTLAAGEPADPAPRATTESEPELDVFGRPPPRGSDWSHRKGEPRLFAFFWTLYMLAATIGAFWSVGAPSARDALSLRPAARTVLGSVTIGIAVLWPMVRLSQRPANATIRWANRSVAQDLLVLLVPAQAIVWPQIAMAGWPVPVVGALSLGLLAWGLVLGALLVIATVWTSVPRALWMAVFVVIAGTGPVLSLAATQPVSDQPDFGWWWMTSPVTTGFEIARDRPWSGSSAAVGPAHWLTLAGVGGLGLACWLVLVPAGLLRRPGTA